MADFYNDHWLDAVNIGSKKFICWNCGNLVASQYGYRTRMHMSCIYLCPHCNAPYIEDEGQRKYPCALPGRPIDKLPDEVQKVYEEARNCIAAGAYTAAVMILRKILMNLSVEEGAEEGKTFAYYVDYLCDNGFVHRCQREQAKKIRRLGNDANHKIESRTKEDAIELLNLVQLILINNYEQADEATNQEPEVVV